MFEFIRSRLSARSQGAPPRRRRESATRRVVFLGTAVALLVLATVAYAASVTCDGGRCEGTDEADQITGSFGPDTIFADAGFDDVGAKPGHDFVQGAEGEDTIKGGRGEDTLRGNSGSDVVNGGRVDDNLDGGGNPDEPPVPSSAGPAPQPDEQLTDTAPNDADSVYGGPGFESINVGDGDGDDYINCGPDGGTVNGYDVGDDIVNCPGI